MRKCWHLCKAMNVICSIFCGEINGRKCGKEPSLCVCSCLRLLCVHTHTIKERKKKKKNTTWNAFFAYLFIIHHSKVLHVNRVFVWPTHVHVNPKINSPFIRHQYHSDKMPFMQKEHQRASFLHYHPFFFLSSSINTRKGKTISCTTRLPMQQINECKTTTVFFWYSVCNPLSLSHTHNLTSLIYFNSQLFVLICVCEFKKWNTSTLYINEDLHNTQKVATTTK